MRLIISWNEFANQIKYFIEEAETLHSKHNQVSDEADLNKVKEEVKDWEKKCYKFLQESFTPNSNDFASGFYSVRTHRYTIPGGRVKDLNQVHKELFEDLDVKQKTLKYYLKTLKVYDAIIKPNEIDLEIRKNYSTEETLELLIDKLYELYDDYYYSVKDILEGNGIELKRWGEERELIKMLEIRGFVKVQSTRDVSAQLTTQGKMYVEEKRKIKSSDYSHVSGSQEEINTKIDTIISELEKLGLGQEILYEELEELKELYSKLDKKNWGQVLKGKLIDLGLSKVISSDTMKAIYSELTDQMLKLS